MKILQVSNIVSHHQMPLARELAKIVGEKNFRFAATSAPLIERSKMGWEMDAKESWVINAYDKQKNIEFEKWWDEADIVLTGERRFSRMNDRVKNKKYCFYTSERWWKPKISFLRLSYPPFFKMAMEYRELSKSEYFFYMAKGYHAAKDIKLIAAKQDNIYQWGYFSEFNEDIHRINNDGCVKVLWVGRFLPWKRIDDLVNSLIEIKERKPNLSFELTLVGDGEVKDKIIEKLSRSILKDCYAYYPYLSVYEVQNLMVSHDIYVLPSSAYEGWGVVINEAMAIGMAVAASSGAGAATAMIQHKENGLIFNPGDVKNMALTLEHLILDVNLRLQLGEKARETIKSLWSPEVAAKRLVNFSNCLLSGLNNNLYETGPLSKFN